MSFLDQPSEPVASHLRVARRTLWQGHWLSPDWRVRHGTTEPLTRFPGRFLWVDHAAFAVVVRSRSNSTGLRSSSGEIRSWEGHGNQRMGGQAIQESRSNGAPSPTCQPTPGQPLRDLQAIQPRRRTPKRLQQHALVQAERKYTSRCGSGSPASSCDERYCRIRTRHEVATEWSHSMPLACSQFCSGTSPTQLHSRQSAVSRSSHKTRVLWCLSCRL